MDLSTENADVVTMLDVLNEEKGRIETNLPEKTKKADFF
jgi:hypothetical protein